MNSNIFLKLKGFSRLRATLHIKVTVNATPFKYGAVMMSYRPMCNLNHELTTGRVPYFSGGQIAGDSGGATGNGTTYPGGMAPGASKSDRSTWMARSQRQHVKIFPQYSKGAEMTLPFCYNEDSIALTNETEIAVRLNEMGTLVAEELCVLRTSGTPSADPCTVNIYAWASDVEVWGPTSVTLQGVKKDENADAASVVPSEVASSIADAAGHLAKVPGIAPMAMATQAAARGASRFLSHFGWSNPPLLEAPRNVTPLSSIVNTSTDISRATQVLSIDSMNETTVDPRVVGIDSKDELDVSYIASRPSIIDTVVWNTTDPAGSVLLAIPVCPAHFRFQSVSNTGTGSFPCKRLTLTPYTFLMNFFKYWRGTFCIKITVVSSQFHRGRLSVSHDPNIEALPQYPGNGRQISEIFDLANGTEIIYKVPYKCNVGMASAPLYWMSQSPFGESTPTCWGNRVMNSGLRSSLLAGTFPDTEDSNGIVFVNVANCLAASDDTSPVELIVETWFEDFQVAVRRSGYSYFGATEASDPASLCLANTIIQFEGPAALGPVEQPSGPVEEVTPAEVVIQGDAITDSVVQTGGESGEEVDILGALYSGESVKSLRNMLHSSQLWYVKDILTYGAAGTIRRWLISSFLTFPLPRCFRTNYNTTSRRTIQLSTLGGASYSSEVPMQLTTPLSLISACYTGYRGSLEWRVGTLGHDSMASSFISISKRVKYASDTTFTETITPAADAVETRDIQTFLGSDMMSCNQIQQQSAVSAVFPYHSRRRMRSVNPFSYRSNAEQLVDTTHQDILDGQFSVVHMFQGLASTRTEALMSVAAGKDFTLMGFVNIPDLYLPAWTQ